MVNERREKLKETMKKFNKGQKEEVLSFGNETEDLEVIPTGLPVIDAFIGGGTKRGTFTIYWGASSVGKTSLTLQSIGNAQKEGKLCCYINLEKPIDKARFEGFGVNLDELVLVNYCKNAEQALEVIRTLCQEKVIDLLVVDSIQAMCPKNTKENKNSQRALAEKEIAELARTMSKFFQVVNADVYRAKASVVFIGQTRIQGIGSFFTRAGLTGGEALKFYAYNIVFMRRGQTVDAPVQKFKEYFLDPDGGLHYATKSETIGFDAVLRMDKTNASESAKEKTDIHVPFYYDTGFIAPKCGQIPGGELKIEGTKEEKLIITNMLIKKGILTPENNPFLPLKADNLIIDDAQQEPPETEKTLIDKDKQIGKLENQELPKKKRGRGRPRKEKK